MSINRILELAGVTSEDTEILNSDNGDTSNIYIQGNVNILASELEEVPNLTYSGGEPIWDEIWERDTLHLLNKSTVIVKTPLGDFDAVDFEIMDHNLSHDVNGVWYDGLVHFWVEFPKSVIKNKEDVDKIKSNISLNLDTPEIGGVQTKLSNVKIIDYDF